MTKKFNIFDNTNLQNDESWGNIELPGLSDEELHSKNWNLTLKRTDKAKQNLALGVKKREANGWLDKVNQSRIDTNSIEYKQAHAKGINNRAKNKKWQTNVAEAARANGSNPLAHEKRKQNLLQQKLNDPEAYHQKMKLARAHKCKRVVTPDGVFASRRECAKHYGHSDSWVGSQIKKRKDWRYE